MVDNRTYYRKVEFRRFKAFKSYRVDLREFNILVGPNNAGKSTIIAAFRILAAAMRKAQSRKAEIVTGPNGAVRGYKIDLALISVAEENIFFNYEDDHAASIIFTLSNGFTLTLYFPEQGACHLIADAAGKNIDNPASFKSNFNCQIGFVPILGPVEHNEQRYEIEAARLALFNYRAARNFRNIWHHYPDHFDEFREVLRQTWPGMDILPPEVQRVDGKTYLYMYCPEKRLPREIFWAGFGFQVWCQMLTHLIQSKDKSLFLIDEPDVYLHSELQRQLLELLRNLGPDILIATHSTEIVTEANADEILVIDKERSRSRRINNPSSVGGVFSILGSNLNPILTQIAKTKRVLFVEGKDYHILGRLARRLDSHRVGNRSDFAVVPIDGFNPERMKNLKAGMVSTLGTEIVSAVVLDRDYRSSDECRSIVKECEKHVDFVTIHSCKELENFLLVPEAIDRAILRQIDKRPSKPGRVAPTFPWAGDVLAEHAETKRSYVSSQRASLARSFGKEKSAGVHETTFMEQAISEIDAGWPEFSERLRMIPGKEALAYVNFRAQEYGVSVTPTGIIEAMRADEIPSEAVALVAMLERFATMKVGEELLDDNVS